jgi:hypothetical protein
MSMTCIGAYGFIILALIMLPVLSEDWPGCKFQCRANDVTVSRVWIGDETGEDLPSAVPGETQSCYLWATINNNANAPRYAAILLADLYLNGTLIQSFYDLGLCVIDNIGAKSSLDYPLYSMIWTRGEEIVLKRFVLSWETAKGTSCNQANRKCSNRNTKCYGGGEMEIQVETPPSPLFSENLQSCKRVVNFLDETIGGVGPYVYDWDFGDGSHSQETNPTHTYSSFGSYIVRLRVIDQSGAEASVSRTIVLNICPCTIVGEEYACQDWTRTYRAIMNDSTQGTIQWHLDGIDMEKNPSQDQDQIEINWQNYEIGEHFLQAYVTDENDPTQWAECNMTITVIAEPLATISFSSVR